MSVRVIQSGGQATAGWPSDSINAAVGPAPRNRLDFFGGVEAGESRAPSVMPGLGQASSRFRMQAVPLRVANEADGDDAGGGDAADSSAGEGVGSADSSDGHDSGFHGEVSGESPSASVDVSVSDGKVSASAHFDSGSFSISCSLDRDSVDSGGSGGGSPGSDSSDSGMSNGP